MQLTEELRKLEQMMDVQLRREELRAAELKVEVSIGETEEKIIDDFLNYWADPDHLDNVNSCVFIADNCDVITGFTEEDVKSCETVTAQEEVLVNKEEDQLEELAYKQTVEIVDLCDFQTEDLCVNAGTISDDGMLQQCQREISLLEYLLENSEYDREIAEERVQYSE